MKSEVYKRELTNYADKNILITGATGLIGRHLVRELLRWGARVYVVGRNISKIQNVFGTEIDNVNLIPIEDNVSESLTVSNVSLDYIFHAASPVSGTDIRSFPVDTILANINGTRNCLELLKKQNKGRLILFSSATVYGNADIKNDIVVSEDMTAVADALYTANIAYSESKRMVEVMARAYFTQYDIDSVIARIGYVYGYCEPMPNTAFYQFIETAISGEDVILNNSGMGRRDNIHVDDVVNGLLLIALKGDSGEAYNISSNGDGDNYKAIDEIAEIIVEKVNKHCNKNVIVMSKNKSCKRSPGMKMDNYKIKKLGWRLEVKFSDGIDRIISNLLNGC